MYSRVFNPSTTKELRLYGLNDDDIFDIEDNVTSRIKIRIIGGKGYDTFDIKGNVETLLYDLKDGGNHIKNNSRAKNRFSTEAPVNDKDIFGFNYNTTRFPQLHFGQNTDDGFWIGGAFSKGLSDSETFPMPVISGWQHCIQLVARPGSLITLESLIISPGKPTW